LYFTLYTSKSADINLDASVACSKKVKQEKEFILDPAVSNLMHRRHTNAKLSKLKLMLIWTFQLKFTY